MESQTATDKTSLISKVNTNLQDFFGTIGPKESGGRGHIEYYCPEKHLCSPILTNLQNK